MTASSSPRASRALQRAAHSSISRIPRISPGARAFLLIAATCAAVLTASGAARADDKSGVSPTRLHLPKGPGSLEGVGENAEPNLSMGLMEYGVPVALPKGYEGASPSLRFAYSSGAGNGTLSI